jgi:hypothetical protein
MQLFQLQLNVDATITKPLRNKASMPIHATQDIKAHLKSTDVAKALASTTNFLRTSLGEKALVL